MYGKLMCENSKSGNKALVGTGRKSSMRKCSNGCRHSVEIPINESLGNPLYFLYKGAGQSLGLILPAVCLNSVALIGVAMNLFVISATIATKSLRGTANFLLALISFLTVLHQSGHLVFLYIAASGTNFVGNQTGVLLDLPMIFGLNATFPAMAAAAFDRLFAIISQNKHSEINKYFYVGSLLFVCIAYGLFWDFYAVSYALQNPNIPTTGLVSEMLPAELNLHCFLGMALFNGFASLCYFLIWLAIRAKKVTDEVSTRLVRSLVIIVSVTIGVYFFSLGLYKVFFAIQEVDYVLIWRMMMFAGICLNVGAACNAPVLYFTSTEYRKAFSAHFNGMLCRGTSGTGESQQPQMRIHRIHSTQIAPLAN